MKNINLNFNYKIAICSLLFALCIGTVNAATTCSRANLTRCLDSACAIGVSSNPSARCQYCGTSAAGAAPKNVMKSVSAGTSAKYNISDKDLKKAPTDPGQRYAWATKQCLSKVAGCTADDVSDTYDSLIEQSCHAAGVSAQMTQTLELVAKTKSKSTCQSDITACVIADKRCMADFRNCAENADFDKFFAACGVESTGCDEHIASIRADLIANRDNAIKNAESILNQIVASYKAAREKKISSIKSGCADNSARDKCVETVCANNMTNGCATGYESEKSMAIQLCKFYEIACATIDRGQ